MPSSPTPITILLISSDEHLSSDIREALATDGAFEMEQVGRLSEAMERLSKKRISAALLDLWLPDSSGIQTLDTFLSFASDVPVLVLSQRDEEATARLAVERGAQDYLVRGRLDSYSLPRAIRNSIERKGIEDALFIEKERAEVTLNSIGDAVLCTDISGYITYLNLVAESMTGWNRQEAIGQPLRTVFQIIDGATRCPVRDPMELAVEQNKTVGLTIDCVLIRRDGLESAIEDSAAPIHDRTGKVIGAVIVFHDVSVARDMSRKMTHSAQHDFVTNLPNRLLLNDRIAQAISFAHRKKKPVGVLFLDLDRFKYINDSLGHAQGDRLLQSVSKRLLASVRASDTVSRQGGDEFVILLSEISHPEDAATSARKILSALNAVHAIGEEDLHIEGSIGISVYPADGEDAESLIKNADAAMYHAKECGRNNFKFFTAAMNQKAVERQSLESALYRALEKQEFFLHFQPKVNLKTGEITGVEALLRWRHPVRGLIPPSQFVPIAEDCGLIVPIGRWVLESACREAQGWQSSGQLPVAVNVSAAEFRAPGFVARVRTILEDTGLDAHRLELELTERVLMDDAESTASMLQELRNMGVGLAVDDFGTGYSSLSYLAQFPIDTLKIDRSFVQKINANYESSSIVSAIIGMGKNLGLKVIAEGVETREQSRYLVSQGCVEGQGYLLSHPISAAELVSFLGNAGRKRGAQLPIDGQQLARPLPAPVREALVSSLFPPPMVKSP